MKKKNLFFPVIDMKATGRNIKRLREERSLTVRDLQDYFGFDAPQGIYKWQRGETLPTVDNLLAMGRVFGVPVESIIAVKAVAVEGRDLIYVIRGGLLGGLRDGGLYRLLKILYSAPVS